MRSFRHYWGQISSFARWRSSHGMAHNQMGHSMAATPGPIRAPRLTPAPQSLRADDGDLVAVAQQTFGQVRADEPRAALPRLDWAAAVLTDCDDREMDRVVWARLQGLDAEIALPPAGRGEDGADIFTDLILSGRHARVSVLIQNAVGSLLEKAEPPISDEEKLGFSELCYLAVRANSASYLNILATIAARADMRACHLPDGQSAAYAALRALSSLLVAQRQGKTAQMERLFQEWVGRPEGRCLSLTTLQDVWPRHAASV